MYKSEHLNPYNTLSCIPLPVFTAVSPALTPPDSTPLGSTLPKDFPPPRTPLPASSLPGPDAAASARHHRDYRHLVAHESTTPLPRATAPLHPPASVDSGMLIVQSPQVCSIWLFRVLCDIVIVYVAWYCSVYTL